MKASEIGSKDIELSADEHQFFVTAHGIPTVRFLWSEIVEAIGFKRDCFSTDQINLVFKFEDGLLYSINEDMQGWKDIVRFLPTVLPSAREYESDWFHEVSQPPFAISRTIVFIRSE